MIASIVDVFVNMGFDLTIFLKLGNFSIYSDISKIKIRWIKMGR